MENQDKKTGYYNEDEINLYDYLQVVWRKKFLIIAICLVGIIAAAIISYRMPPIYRVTASVSPGWIYIDKQGKGTSVDSAENIKALIVDGSFNTRIIESLRLNPVLSNVEFKTKLARGTEAVSIFYDTENPVEGKMITGELIKQLLEYYRTRTDIRRNSIENSITMMKNQIKNSENKKIRAANEKKKIMSDMELLKKKADLLRTTEKYLNNQVKSVEENTKLIMQEKNEVLKKGEKADTIALLLYSNTIQQNISYIDRLNADLERNRLEQESAKNELSKNEIELKNKDTELKDVDTEVLDTLQKIRNLEIDRVRVEGLKIVQEPYVSSKPVKPKKMQNIAIAGFSSLFLGIFSAFFIEFLKKQRNRSNHAF